MWDAFVNWITNGESLGANIGNALLWFLTLPFLAIFLVLDGITYSLVAYSYKLFELMSRLNMSSLSQ